MTSTAYLPLLIDALARTVPADKDRSEDARKASLAEARMLFEAWQPADAMEAALAARAVAAHFAAMDSFARAAKPGMSDESVIRLRGNAIAAGRVFDNLRREFRRLRQPAAAEPQPRARRQTRPGPPRRPDRPRGAGQPARGLAQRNRPRRRPADGPRSGLTGRSAAPAHPPCVLRMQW